MTIELDILTTLNNHAGLFALVGNRNYAVNLPQNPTYPNTVNMRISSNPTNSLGSRSTLMNIRLQLDVRGNTLNSASLATTQAINAMENATLFKGLLLTSNHIPKEVSTDSYRISTDFSLWYNEI